MALGRQPHPVDAARPVILEAPYGAALTLPEPVERRWIGIDGRNLKLREGTGVASYARGVAEAIELVGARAELVTDQLPGVYGEPPAPRRGLLAQVAKGVAQGARRADPATLFGGRLLLDGTGRRQVERLRLVDDVFRGAATRFRVTGRFLALESDDPPALMHWTYPLPLEFVGAPNVYTVHDLIPLTDPGLTGIKPGVHRRLLATIVRRGDHIVTASDCTRRELIARFGCREDRVTTTFVPVDMHLDPPAQAPAAVAAELAEVANVVPGGYFLFVGSVEPRKNLARLGAAHRASGTSAPLVLAGPDGWHAAEALSGLESLCRNSPIRRLPFLGRATLLNLVAHAKALLFPSLAEGFGIPLVEAMLLGTPVMTSNRGALAEIAGHAALGVDPLDVGAMAEAIRRLDTDPMLREGLAARGRQRAPLFSPTAHAERLGRVYDTVTGRAWRARAAE